MVPGGPSRDITDVYGLRRFAKTGRGSTDVTIESTQDSNMGHLTSSLASPEAPVSLNNYIQLRYFAVDLALFSGFDLNISEISGIGEFIVRVDDNSIFLDDSFLRLPLTGPGIVSVPPSLVNGFVPDVPVGVVDFSFITRSTDFSFTLEEIIIVPEPSAALLSWLGIAGLVLIRGRRRGLEQLGPDPRSLDMWGSGRSAGEPER